MTGSSAERIGIMMWQENPRIARNAIQKQNRVVSFFVEDNGKGFDISEVSVKNPDEKGMGLAAMYERARMVGSSLDIWTQNGKGTKISFTIPTKRGER